VPIVLQHKSSRSRNSDPFLVAINSIVGERSEWAVPILTSESQSEEEPVNEQEIATTAKEKRKNIFSLPVSPRIERRERIERFRKRGTRTGSLDKLETFNNNIELEARQAVAMHNYVAKDTTEISFKRGDIISNVVDHTDAVEQGIRLPNQFWLHGEIHGKSGLFPLNFVEVIFPRGTKATAEYDFTPENEDELSLKPGEEILLISMAADGWYRGRNENGDMGLFPHNYVRRKE